MKVMIIKIMIVFFLCLFLWMMHDTYKTETIKFQGKPKDEYVHVTIDNQVHDILLDDYLLGVVGGEMPASFEMEALKAQVVASRTFVYSRLLAVDNTTNSQVYLNDEDLHVSWGDNYQANKTKIQEAILQTQDEIITYQGQTISALFYASSNGFSENVEDYFQGSEKPYLKSVSSPWDQNYDPQFQRVYHFTKKQLQDIFQDQFNYQDITYKNSGRVNTIKICQRTYTGRQVRELLSLASSDFEIKQQGDGYDFITKGSGHGVGMSQYGAQGMAKEGYGYQDILKYYYQGVEITKTSINSS